MIFFFIFFFFFVSMIRRGRIRRRTRTTNSMINTVIYFFPCSGNPTRYLEGEERGERKRGEGGEWEGKEG